MLGTRRPTSFPSDRNLLADLSSSWISIELPEELTAFPSVRITATVIREQIKVYLHEDG